MSPASLVALTQVVMKTLFLLERHIHRAAKVNFNVTCKVRVSQFDYQPYVLHCVLYKRALLPIISLNL